MFSGIWEPKFPISSQDVFVTAGSCFAQHIGRWLSNHDYRWLDSEPAPTAMPDDAAALDGYGVFSFRTANIYTAALLRQWVSWAVGLAPVIDDIARADGRYHDMFRPSIPANGYASESDLREARTVTLRAIKGGLEKATVFVFTLGLTEAWVHKDGYVYPMCPGTLRGTFDKQKHSLVNFNVKQVLDDLEYTFAAIRKMNPAIRFLLTVSPVPLTATASQQHVMTATTYSKSVLRSAAGELSARCADVDYFPSFELISSAAVQGRHYEQNLRTVSPSGVDFVMAHFAEALGEGRQPVVLSEVVAQEANVFCEDARLDDWVPTESDVLLFGSSHMDRLSEALQALGVKHVGGRIMDGSRWYNDVFALDEESYFVPLQDRGSRLRWDCALSFFSATPEAGRSPQVILTDLGVQSHMAVADLRTLIQTGRVPPEGGLAPAVEFFMQRHAKKLEVLQRLRDEGFAILVITDPPTQHLGGFGERDLLAFSLYDLIVEQMMAQLGLDVFVARRELAGLWTPDFESDAVRPESRSRRDWIHGSASYYHAVAVRVVDRMGLAAGTTDPAEEAPERDRVVQVV